MLELKVAIPANTRANLCIFTRGEAQRGLLVPPTTAR